MKYTLDDPTFAGWVRLPEIAWEVVACFVIDALVVWAVWP